MQGQVEIGARHQEHSTITAARPEEGERRLIDRRKNHRGSNQVFGVAGLCQGRLC